MTIAQLSTPGERLKRARMLAGIATRREFAQRHGMSAHTLQSWEQGKSVLTTKGAQRLVSALQQEGWLCSVEWLLQGAGLPPRHFIRHESVESHLSAETRIYREIQFFKETNPNAIVLTIADDTMEPFFSIGDTVGGIQFFDKEISRYLGMFCILELEHNQILTRLLQPSHQRERYTAACTHSKTTAAAPLNI